jgi:hypothetical protein
MSGWKIARAPQLVPHYIDPKQYQHELAELARLLYSRFCQTDSLFQGDSLTTESELRNEKEFR